MQEQSLRHDIEAFFQPRVHEYLEKEIKKTRPRPFSPSHAMTIIKAFEEEIAHLELPPEPGNQYKATLDQWKKAFTRNILVPHYLVHNPYIELEKVLQMIKEALYASCQEVKVASYIQTFQKTIVNSLRSVPPLERMKRARQILSSSAKVLQKLEKNFPKELFLSAFPKEKLQELVDAASQPTTHKEVKASAAPPAPRRIRSSYTKPSSIDEELVKTYLRSHILPELIPTFQDSSPLLHKLQAMSAYFATIPTLIPAWLSTWSDKPLVKEEALQAAALKCLPSLLLELRAEIIAHSCHQEILSARETISFHQFPEAREAIIERYLRFYLQEPALRELFLRYLRDEETTQHSRFLPPTDTLEPPTPKSPSKKSLWRRV